MAAVGDQTRARQWQTHTVANQVPPLEGVDVFSSNLPLVEATKREGASWALGRATELG
jgi:putative acyl-CoA dehydrogenase